VPSPLPPPPDLTGFRTQLGQLLAAGDHAALVAAVVALVEQMAQTNHDLTVRLQAALRLLYRKKSERVAPEQLALFLAPLPPETAAQALPANRMELVGIWKPHPPTRARSRGVRHRRYVGLEQSKGTSAGFR